MKDHSDSILWPADARAAGLATIGGKAAGLVRLERAGAPVPPWFAVGAEAYARHAERALGAELLGACSAAIDADDTEGLATACAAAQAALLEQRLNSGLEAAITLALERLGEGPYAVRSSMIGEDDEAFSFAGQLETYLHQADVSAVCDAVIRCWSAALAPRVLTYRKRAGLALVDLRMAVIVQRMINGTVSGVLFTVDPTTGNRQQALLSACWGLGEGVVDGSCNTDEFVWDHAEGLVDRRISDKDRMVVPRQGGSGTEEIDTPVTQRNTSCLADDEVEAILSAGLAVAHQLGAPQDIEWTIGGGTLYLLQARPITSLPPVAEGPRVVWDNSNIQESYCGVTTPLTFSFASGAYASVYRQTMEALRIPAETIRDHGDMLRNMLGVVRGRIYYNINNWYRGLLLLPSFGRNKADMEQMMGLDDPVDFIIDEALSWTEKARRTPRLVTTFAHLKRLFGSLDRDVARFQADFEAAYSRIDRGRFSTMSFSALHQVIGQLRREMLENWHTPIINDFYVMMAMGQLRRLVRKAGFGDGDILVNNLMSGEEGIESTEPTRFIMRLARDARQAPEILTILAGSDNQVVLDALARQAPEFRRAVDDYIERYGDRVMGELKLETVSLREDPTFLFRVVRNFADRDDLDPDALADQEKALREAAESELRRGLGPLARRRMPDVLASARKAIKNRENMRLARTRMFGLFRDVYRALGERLREAGKLSHGRDVFYLTVDEIDAYMEGRAVTTNLGGLADLRRSEWGDWEDRDIPHQFETLGPVYHGNHFEAPSTVVAPSDDGSLQGKPCYPGVITAPARVILKPDDDLSVNGQILVTVRTDPGWAPLFPTASGILVERGSTLSHSAVLARELGIPAVVGVPGLLQLVSNGDTLRMDGGTGRVEILS